MYTRIHNPQVCQKATPPKSAKQQTTKSNTQTTYKLHKTKPKRKQATCEQLIKVTPNQTHKHQQINPTQKATHSHNRPTPTMVTPIHNHTTQIQANHQTNH